MKKYQANYQYCPKSKEKGENYNNTLKLQNKIFFKL